MSGAANSQSQVASRCIELVRHSYCGPASDADSPFSVLQRDVRSVHVVDLARAALLLFGSPRICVHGPSIALEDAEV